MENSSIAPISEGEGCKFKAPCSLGYRRCAFTLAEVLITLGIIGVVAAMTIPTLINKINLIAFKSQIKQEYSQTISTIKLMQDDNEREYRCYYSDIYGSTQDRTDCTVFWRTFFRYRKLSHICAADDYSCRPKYVVNNKKITAGGGQAGYCALFANDMPGYVLQNGAIYYPWLEQFNNNTSGVFPQIFTVDVNGIKGPNKYGYDVFYVNLQKTNKGLIFSNVPCSPPVEKGGRSLKDMLK